MKGFEYLKRFVLGSAHIPVNRKFSPVNRNLEAALVKEKRLMNLKEIIVLMELKLKEVLARIISTRRLSVKEISRGTAVSVSTLHEWLAGRSPRNPLQIKAVSTFLGVSLDELLFDESPAHSPSTIDPNQLESLEGVFQISLKRIKVPKGVK